MDAEFWEKVKPRFVQPQEGEITPTQQEYQILIHCLVNRSHALERPTDKKYCTNQYYDHHNYTVEQIPLNRVCEETLLQGFQFIPGEFTHNPNPDIGIRDTVNWQSQQLFLVEFDNPTENTADAFISTRPFLQQHAWFLTESLRSRYNDPNDEKCNGQLRVRAAFCMPHAVKDLEERDWIYQGLLKDLPGCDDGSAISVTNGGLGKYNAKHIKIGKIVGIDWFNRAIDTGKKVEQEKTSRTETYRRGIQTQTNRTRSKGIYRARRGIALRGIGKNRSKSLFAISRIITQIREREIPPLGQNRKARRYRTLHLAIRLRLLSDTRLCQLNTCTPSRQRRDALYPLLLLSRTQYRHRGTQTRYRYLEANQRRPCQSRVWHMAHRRRIYRQTCRPESTLRENRNLGILA